MQEQEKLAFYKRCLRSAAAFAAGGSGLRLRKYQRGVARAVCDSVMHKKGLTFVVIFPRQSGKNELQAQIEAYLLTMLMQDDAEIVKVSPTWKPQSLNAMRRLERALTKNILVRENICKESGYIFRIKTARIYFLSGEPTSNVVGATASTLLECDEAQDVLISKWDKEFNPMAASTNATRVFWGTAWTSQTLLARELRAAQAAEQQDGIQRVFRVTADEVAREVPAYGKFVQNEIARHGRDHPYIRTQFYCQEIDGEAGMFPPARRALMQGGHPPLAGPQPGELYAFLLDIAGEDETVSDPTSNIQNPTSRDSTALTIVRIDLSQLGALRAPRYQVVQRRLWTGVKHTQIFGQLVALGETWNPRWIVCDNTGIGAGLTSFLSNTFGKGRVIPFTFNRANKSKLGWDFLAIVENGRFQDHVPLPPFHPPIDAEVRVDGGKEGGLQALFWRQVEACQMEILTGPGQVIRWGVLDNARDLTGSDPAHAGALIHDDLLVSAALCAALEKQSWGAAESAVIDAPDPMVGFGEVF